MEVSGKIEIPIVVYNEMKDSIKKDDEKIVELSKKISKLENDNASLKQSLDGIISSSIFERLFRWEKLTRLQKQK